MMNILYTYLVITYSNSVIFFPFSLTFHLLII